MSCDSERWQSEAAYSDMKSCLSLLEKEMDMLEEDKTQATRTERIVFNGEIRARYLKSRYQSLEELYDRLSDLLDMVNCKENDEEPEEKPSECDDDDCDCHN